AARTSPNDAFYDFPFPSDLRTTTGGYPDLSGIPATTTTLVETAIEFVQTERPGFSPSSGIYFRFDQGLDPASLPALADSMSDTSPVQLIDIDPGSPAYGERLPVYIHFQQGRTAFWRTNMLAIRPMYGRTMRNGTRYAVVLTRDLRSFDGGPVRPAEGFVEILDGTATGEVADHYRLVLDELDAIGLDRNMMVSVTSFTTSDVVSEMLALRNAAYDGPVSTITGWEKGEGGPSHD